MAATDPHWLGHAKTLAAGRTKRIECCATDKSLLVSNDPKGYRAYCFRCGPQGFVAHGDFSIDVLKRRRAELALQHERTVKLPTDFTLDIPTSEAVWLYKAGISAALARHYRFGYSAFLRRVILPIYSNDELQGFVARSTINARPKYIEKMVRPTEAVFVADASTAFVPVREVAVLTEDILSAVRVGRHVTSAIALLGTSSSAQQLRTVQNHNRIAVWLDPDRAGVGAGQKVARSLRLRGHEVRIIRTARDPKYYSNREIRSILNDE